MPEALLRTKLYVPPRRPNHVTRARLVALLNAGQPGRLTLVSAPAGYGKSTVLSDWARQNSVHVAWLSLDKEDNASSRFWSYFAAALQTIPQLRQAGVGEILLNSLTARHLPPVEELLTVLVNEIACLDGQYILVLDDLHSITNPEIHAGLIFLLDFLPATVHGMRLVVASRSDPPWPLARLRARGDLTELRESDLRFVGDEVRYYLNQTMNLGLTPNDLSALETRTEGWITGLQMAAISLLRRQQTLGGAGVSQFIANFTGGHRFVLDYLVEEVFSQQPVDIQAFLLKTSILKRLTAPLCEVVAGIDGGQAMLRRLEAHNLFLIPLDEERGWYRYHHLFAELMRRKLVQNNPEVVSGLHKIASRWFEENALLNEAVSHAQVAADHDRAARLVEEHGMSLLVGSELTTLRAWLDGLPEAVICRRPWLSIFSAWVSYYAGPRERADTHLLDAERALTALPAPMTPDATEVRRIQGHIAALRAYLALQNGELDLAATEARLALANLPDGDYARATSAIALAETWRSEGNLVEWHGAYRRALSIALASENLPMAVSAATYMADQLVKQGCLHEARAGYLDALLLATGPDGAYIPAGGLPCVKLGDLLREWGELAPAREYLSKGIKLCQKWGHSDSLVIGYVALARTALAEGDSQTATSAFQKAVDRVQRTAIDPWTSYLIDNLRIRLWLAEGNLSAARHWIADAGLKSTDELHFLRDLEHINLLRLLLAVGQHATEKTHLEEAEMLADRLLERAETAGWVAKLIEILVLRARIYQAKGEMTEAQTSLRRALRQAETGGYLRIFADEGSDLESILEAICAENPDDVYARRLLDACRMRPEHEVAAAAWQSAAGSDDAASLVETLSDREMEVLHLLSSKLTVPEIALELTIAVSTTRTHVRNIYGKLGVHGRIEAIQRAHDLRLI